MAKQRDYGFYKKDGFEFACPRCGVEFHAGVDRLERNPTFECYHCGESVTIEHCDEMVTTFRAAQTAMQRLHEAIDQRQEVTRAIVMNAELYRTWWGKE